MATVIVHPRVCTLIGNITAVSTSLTALTFGMNDLTYRGALTIAATSGAVTTPTFVLEASLDNGLTFFVVPVLAAPVYGVTGLIGVDTAAIFAARYDISSLSGSLMKFGLTVGTAITSMPIYALVS